MSRGEILKTILAQSKRGEIPLVKTVKRLAELAGISRVSLYKYYPHVISALRADNECETVPSIASMTKFELLKSRYIKTKTDLECLTSEYLKVLLQMEDMKAFHEDSLSGAEYRIRLLEEKLARHERPGPRSVK